MNSRYLILPWVAVTNLASHALARVVRQLQADWQQRWGITPLLVETFFVPTEQRGSSYRAADWQAIDHTTGGKAVYTFALQPDARAVLCQSSSAVSPSVPSRAPKRSGAAADLWGVIALAATQTAERYDQR
ncbi:MAG: DUF4338 domain-containing protein [Aestuariivita sp.]|nr:DUF4338 domain-containing protein [Aestuariivita sp.]MCY4202246.1 DUF4338 domain-containing protein [Aestuariivita sp.]